MKKILSILTLSMLIVCMLVPLGVSAAPKPQDVSQLVIDEESGESTAQVSTDNAEVGTDVFLWVDPDSATYVTFIVQDEDGVRIESAEIYLTVYDEKNLYGITDKIGTYSMNVFRDMEYPWEVKKEGYESASGKFTVHKETGTVYVTLRKLHALDVYVVDGDKPVPGVKVIVDGVEKTTDKNGKVTYMKPNGEYEITVINPKNGKKILRDVVVHGHTKVVVDIADGNWRYTGDGFLVYDKLYNPRDYDFIEMKYSPDDLTQKPGESDEDFAARQAAYMEKYSSTLLIKSKQEDIPSWVEAYNMEGPVYTQRSLMPTGSIMKRWIDEGYTNVTFTDGGMDVALTLSDTYTGKMAKLFGYLYALHSDKNYDGIVTDEAKSSHNYAAENGLEPEDISLLDVDDINFDALKDAAFSFDTDKGGNAVVVPDDVYLNTLFEVKICPIMPDAIYDAIFNGIKGEDVRTYEIITLRSAEAYREQMRRWEADGHLTVEDYEELLKFMVDDRFSEEEIAELHEMAVNGTLTDEMIHQIAEDCVTGQAYRDSVWIHYEGTSVEVTKLLPNLYILVNVDDMIAQEEASIRADWEAAGTEITPEAEKEIHAKAKENVLNAYSMFMVNDHNVTIMDEEFEQGVNTVIKQPVLLESLPEEDDMFYEEIVNREYPRTKVKVHQEEVAIGDENVTKYVAEADSDTLKLPHRTAFVVDEKSRAMEIIMIN